MEFWFWIDMPASVPLSWFGLESTTILGFFKTLRLLRIGRLLKYIEKFQYANIWRIVRLVVFFALIAHILGCMWKFVVSGIAEGWEVSNGLVDVSNTKAYLVSFYSALCMLLGENVEPERTGEIVMHTLLLMLGAILQAYIFGQVGLLIADSNSSSGQYKAKIDVIREVMNTLILPNELQVRIYNYYEYFWNRHRGLSHLNMFDDLSEPLISEICLHLHADHVQRVVMFQGCQPGFLVAIVNKMLPRIFLPSDFIIVKGESGREMYFIRKGICSVIAAKKVGEKGKVICQILEGSSFGEMALYGRDSRRSATVMASTYCDLDVLEKTDFMEILKEYPEMDEKIKDSILIKASNFKEKLSTNRMASIRRTSALHDINMSPRSRTSKKTANSMTPILKAPTEDPFAASPQFVKPKKRSRPKRLSVAGMMEVLTPRSTGSPNLDQPSSQRSSSPLATGREVRSSSPKSGRPKRLSVAGMMEGARQSFSAERRNSPRSTSAEKEPWSRRSGGGSTPLKKVMSNSKENIKRRLSAVGILPMPASPMGELHSLQHEQEENDPPTGHLTPKDMTAFMEHHGMSSTQPSTEFTSAIPSRPDMRTDVTTPSPVAPGQRPDMLTMEFGAIQAHLSHQLYEMQLRTLREINGTMSGGDTFGVPDEADFRKQVSKSPRSNASEYVEFQKWWQTEGSLVRDTILRDAICDHYIASHDDHTSALPGPKMILDPVSPLPTITTGKEGEMRAGTAIEF
jgi:CRP-like cAMP-binding protein